MSKNERRESEAHRELLKIASSEENAPTPDGNMLRVLEWIVEYSSHHGLKSIADAAMAEAREYAPSIIEHRNLRERLSLLNVQASLSPEHLEDEQIKEVLVMIQDLYPGEAGTTQALVRLLKGHYVVFFAKATPIKIEPLVKAIQLMCPDDEDDKELRDDMIQLYNGLLGTFDPPRSGAEVVKEKFRKYNRSAVAIAFSTFWQEKRHNLSLPLLDQFVVDFPHETSLPDPAGDHHEERYTPSELQEALNVPPVQFQAIFNQKSPRVRTFLKDQQEKKRVLSREELRDIIPAPKSKKNRPPPNNDIDLEEEALNRKKPRTKNPVGELRANVRQLVQNGSDPLVAALASSPSEKLSPPEDDPDFQPRASPPRDDEPAVPYDLKSPDVPHNLISKQKSNRRPRRNFTPEEVDNLYQGIVECGLGNWAQIVNHYKFNKRTPKDLQDKWRNLEKYRPQEMTEGLMQAKAKHQQKAAQRKDSDQSEEEEVNKGEQGSEDEAE